MSDPETAGESVDESAPPTAGVAEPAKYQFEVVYMRDNGQYASEFILAEDFVAAATKAQATFYKVKTISQVN
jgi:hypothetical protein